jgi:hypothetical protein
VDIVTVGDAGGIKASGYRSVRWNGGGDRGSLHDDYEHYREERARDRDHGKLGMPKTLDELVKAAFGEQMMAILQTRNYKSSLIRHVGAPAA